MAPTTPYRDYYASLPLNLPHYYQVPSVFGYDPIVEGQPRVFLISGYLEDSFNKTTFKLREKTILKFERDGADSLSVDRADSPAMAFAKKGSDWRLTKPAPQLAARSED